MKTDSLRAVVKHINRASRYDWLEFWKWVGIAIAAALLGFLEAYLWF